MQTVTQHGRTAKDRFELVIRLQQSRGSQPSDAGLRLRAQALLKDILMSRLEVEAEIFAGLSEADGSVVDCEIAECMRFATVSEEDNFAFAIGEVETPFQRPVG